MTIMFFPKSTVLGPIQKFQDIVHLRPTMILLGLSVWFLAGCSARETAVLLQEDPVLVHNPALPTDSPGDMATGAPDTLATLSIDSIPAAQVFALPLGPDGFASLADLEKLHLDALDLAAEGSPGLARDLLFVLHEQVSRPRPQDTDSFYDAQCASLERRAWLLGGILAEQLAFQDNPALADSLLTTGYGRLSNLAFPDSLVPASGITLDAITADLLVMDNQAVRRWEDHFTGRGRTHFQYWLDRKTTTEEMITRILDEEGLPRELIYLGMIESGLSSRAVSSVGAVGPWQFMPGTAKGYNLRNDWWADERRDLEMSTRAAVQHIQMLHDQFGDWALVLAAYNGGHGRMARKIRQHGHDNFWEMRLPSQTTAYVPKFIAAAKIGAEPEKYGFEIKEVPPLAYDVIRVNDATDLEMWVSFAEGMQVASQREYVYLNLKDYLK